MSKFKKWLTGALLNALMWSMDLEETAPKEDKPHVVEKRKEVTVAVLKTTADATIPTYAHGDDAGFDLYAVEDAVIYAGQTVTIPTGLVFQIPETHEMQIRPRSGLSLKTKLRIANSPATIDAGFRGEVKVVAENIGTNFIQIRKGDRIAQGVLNEVPKARFMEVSKLGDSDRGEGGFGSTGVNANE